MTREVSELWLGQGTPDKYHASSAREAKAGASTPGHESAGAAEPPFPLPLIEMYNALRKNLFWWILESVPHGIC